jgi:hypothetical protein
MDGAGFEPYHQKYCGLSGRKEREYETLYLLCLGVDSGKIMLFLNAFLVEFAVLI